MGNSAENVLAIQQKIKGPTGPMWMAAAEQRALDWDNTIQAWPLVAAAYTDTKVLVQTQQGIARI